MAGPTFAKLGQWGATRPDILPNELCMLLSGLHHQAPWHTMSWNRYLIQQHFGVELDELFEWITPKPVGSGSVAQVHRAKVRKTGQLVAVKLTHPNVEDRIEPSASFMALSSSISFPI